MLSTSAEHDGTNDNSIRAISRQRKKHTNLHPSGLNRIRIPFSPCTRKYLCVFKIFLNSTALFTCVVCVYIYMRVCVFVSVNEDKYVYTYSRCRGDGVSLINVGEGRADPMRYIEYS